MCVGPEIAALIAAGTAVGGTYAQNRSVRAQTEEANRMRQAEQGRQRELQQEADQQALSTLAQFDPSEQSRMTEQAAQKREQALTPQAPAAPEYAPPSEVSAPTVVKEDLARRIGDALSKGKQSAQRAARLSAYGDTNLANAFATNRAGQRIGQVANFSRGSTGVLPFELEQAQKKGGNWSAAADGLNAVSSLASLYSMTGTPGTGQTMSKNPATLGPRYQSFYGGS